MSFNGHISVGGTSASENIFTIRAPPEQSYIAARKHLASPENQMMLQLQFQYLLDWNTRNAAKVDCNYGKALEPEALRLIFYICERLKVIDRVKLTALEIYDRWLTTYHKDINKASLSGKDLTACAHQLQKDLPIRICSCIQLASKMTGAKTHVSNAELKTELRRMGISTSIDKLISSELRIFRGSGYTVNVLTPLEVIELLVMFVNLESSEFRMVYGLCVHIIDYVLFFKNTIYTTLRTKLHQQYGITKTDEDMVHIEYDYILRGAAIIQCSMFMIRPQAPRSVLDILQTYTRLESDEILLLAICIATSLLGQG